MTKTYYINNMFWGYFMMLVMVYLNYNDHTIEGLLMLTLSIPSAIFFPFSKMLIEKFALKYTTKKFWNTGLFINTPAKHGGVALYHLFCFIFSIPFSIIYLALYFTKNRITN